MLSPQISSDSRQFFLAHLGGRTYDQDQLWLTMRIIIREAEPFHMIALERKTSKGVWVNRDMSDIHADLEAGLRSAGLWEALDYFDLTSAMKQKKIKRFPDFRWIACFPVAEPEQGHYVHVEAITASKKCQLIFVGKTVKGF
jgi:hypothetical protein